MATILQTYTTDAQMIDFLRSCIRSNLAWNPDTDEIINRGHILQHINDNPEHVYNFDFGLWYTGFRSDVYESYLKLITNWRRDNLIDYNNDSDAANQVIGERLIELTSNEPASIIYNRRLPKLSINDRLIAKLKACIDQLTTDPIKPETYGEIIAIHVIEGIDELLQ